MTYSRMICGGSNMMRVAGADGLTWADAPNQACTVVKLPPLRSFSDKLKGFHLVRRYSVLSTILAIEHAIPLPDS